MKTEIIEILLVVIIVLIQVYVFQQTFSKIRFLKKIVPDIQSLTVVKLYINLTELNNSSAREILLNSNNYKKLNSISSDLFVGNQLFDLENDTFDHNSLNISSVTSMIEINIIESNDNENTFFNFTID